MKIKIKTDELNLEIEKEYEHSMSEVNELISKVVEKSLELIKQKQIK